MTNKGSHGRRFLVRYFLVCGVVFHGAVSPWQQAMAAVDAAGDPAYASEMPVAPSVMADRHRAADATGRTDPSPALRSTVDEAIASIRQQYQVAGVVVGVSIDGTHQFFDYGVASRDTKRPVSQRTLFEVGSVSKTFAAAVAERAQAQGGFQWNDPVSKVVPALRGSAFDRIRMWQLGTHTTGLPLQVPDEVTNDAQLIDYLQHWTPPRGQSVGEVSDLHRLYSNVGTGLLGRSAADSMGRDYATIVEHDMLPALGMRGTYLTVPLDRMADYAQGYTRDDRPIRVQRGVLGDEAYGVKSSAEDLLHYLDLQIAATQAVRDTKRGPHVSDTITDRPATNGALPETIGRRAAWLAALAGTQRPWVRAGVITQDLMWEQYPYPVTVATLQEGCGAPLASALPARVLPQATSVTVSTREASAVWINKTGSTNGFGAYLVFIPQRRIGLVMLFNKNVPIAARVAAAAKIVSAIDSTGVK